MSFTVAILGRPNVGKSTLFNRLVGKKLAIVDDTPGVTRDRREGEGSIADLDFRVIDTAGLEEAFDDSLEARMRRQTEAALDDAHVILFLIDARAGVTPLDNHFADWLRARDDKPVILLANKSEGADGQPGFYEAYGLGLGDPVPFSAEHGEGIGELYDALQPHHDDWMAENADPEDDDEAEVGSRAKPLQLAIVGRPNVGKSTLINRMIGEDRLLTGPEAGITRDSIAVELEQDDRFYKLHDTAGLRRRARVTAKVESLSAADTRRAIQYAQVVVLLLDANDMLEKQDLTIARQVIDEGRALVIGVNKWDDVDDRQEAMQKLRDRLEKSLPQVKGVPVVTLSAKTGRGIDKLLPQVDDIYDIWNKRLPTSLLNRWLNDMLDQHPPPMVSGRRLKLRYMTQAKSRPPTFAIFANKPTQLPDAYSRYIVNGLREDFDMPGIPIRINVRGGKNPYAKD